MNFVNNVLLSRNRLLHLLVLTGFVVAISTPGQAIADSKKHSNNNSAVISEVLATYAADNEYSTN